MDVKLRRGTPEDAAACGRILYKAFAEIGAARGFPSNISSPEVAIGLLAMQLAHPAMYGVVAEVDGRVVGSSFLDERSIVGGVGSVSVEPVIQGSAIGRQLMVAVMERAAERGFPGVRLVQSAYNNRSLALYAKLGFEVREPLVCLQGLAFGVAIDGYTIRPASSADLEACNQVCRTVHGHDRAGEVSDALAHGSVLVAEHDGRITGYSTGVAFFGHSAGETTEDIKALIGSAPELGGPGILVPARNSTLFQWCLQHGLRIIQVMTLMTTGLYNEPAGAYLPSIIY